MTNVAHNTIMDISQNPSNLYYLYLGENFGMILVKILVWSWLVYKSMV